VSFSLECGHSCRESRFEVKPEPEVSSSLTPMMMNTRADAKKSENNV